MTSQTPAVVLAISILVVAVMNMIEITEPTSIAVYAQNVENATKNFLSNNTLSQSNRTSEPISPIDNLKIDHAGGTFTSLQTDNDNKTWIATGDWDLISDPLRANQSNSSVVGFNATIGMRGTDNSAGHEHKISNFKLMRSSVGSSAEGSEFVFNGTATIETDVGLYSDVPVVVRINDEGPAIVSINTQTNEVKPQWIPQGGTISVLIDERVEDHFGSTPVYGDVKEEK
ncbi:MAG TPA: hypothetical protein VFG90_07655 [Nitrososphaeraceae archaeon]|nr:hypothetical protein [Nitrososphaeraceae archaeon]